jgi:hypothetical protein
MSNDKNHTRLIKTWVGLNTCIISTIIWNYPDKALYLYVKHNKPNKHIGFWNRRNWMHPALVKTEPFTGFSF